MIQSPLEMPGGFFQVFMFEYFINASSRTMSMFCRVPARWGLQQTHCGLRAAMNLTFDTPLL